MGSRSRRSNRCPKVVFDELNNNLTSGDTLKDVRSVTFERQRHQRRNLHDPEPDQRSQRQGMRFTVSTGQYHGDNKLSAERKQMKHTAHNAGFSLMELTWRFSSWLSASWAWWRPARVARGRAGALDLKQAMFADHALSRSRDPLADQHDLERVERVDGFEGDSSKLQGN